MFYNSKYCFAMVALAMSLTSPTHALTRSEGSGTSGGGGEYSSMDKTVTLYEAQTGLSIRFEPWTLAMQFKGPNDATYSPCIVDLPSSDGKIHVKMRNYATSVASATGIVVYTIHCGSRNFYPSVIAKDAHAFGIQDITVSTYGYDLFNSDGNTVMFSFIQSPLGLLPAKVNADWSATSGVYRDGVTATDESGRAFLENNEPVLDR